MIWGSMPEADRAEQLAMMNPTPEQAREQLDVMLGTYPQQVAHRAPFVFMSETAIFLIFFLWRAGGMMLLGMALYKARFLDGRWSNRAYAIVAGVCLMLGWSLAGYGVSELEGIRFTMPQRSTVDLWNYTGAVFASVGYAAALLLLVKRQALAALRRRLAAVGQTALSNYLCQSIIAAIIFLGWGVGLAGRLDYFEQLVLVLAIWVVQLAVAPLWLAHFRFGPAEWLWRSLTYWQRQPLRRALAESAQTDRVAAGA